MSARKNLISQYISTREVLCEESEPLDSNLNSHEEKFIGSPLLSSETLVKLQSWALIGLGSNTFYI